MGSHRATAQSTDCKVHLHFLRPFQSPLIGQIEVIGHGLERRPGHCQSLFKHWKALIQSHNHYYFSLSSVTVELFGPTAYECHRSVHTKQQEPITAAPPKSYSQGKAARMAWLLFWLWSPCLQSPAHPPFADFYIKLQFSSGSVLCLLKFQWRKMVTVSFQIQRKDSVAYIEILS